MDDIKRKAEQRAAREKQMSDIEASLDRASNLIERSQTEVRRSRDLMDAQREDARSDKEEDEQGYSRRPPT